MQIWSTGIIAGFSGLFVATGEAAAGPWVREPGEKLVIASLSSHEFNAGPDQPSLSKREASVFYEHGLLDRITLVSRIALHDFEYDEVTSPQPVSGFTGLGSSHAGLRFSVLERGRWAVSVEGLYHFDTPEFANGVFSPNGGEDFETRAGLGRSFGEHGHADVQIAWRERGDFQGEEYLLDTTLGVGLGQKLRVMFQTYSVWSEGNEAIYLNAYEGHRLQASVRYHVMQNWAVQAGYLTSLSADNISEEDAVMISLWRQWR